MLKTKIVAIEPQVEGQPINRDAGKVYILTEMPMFQAERWARRAIGAMSRQELDVRAEFGKLGFLGFFMIGLQALAGGDMDAVDALMNEMVPCFQIQTSEKHSRPLGGDGDIEELSTIYRLRKELIELHMGFTFAELALILQAAASPASNSPTTQTSDDSSATS